MTLERAMMTMLVVATAVVIAMSNWYAIDEIKHEGVMVKQT